MSKTAITSPELAPPVGPFSQAVKIDGFLFFSGQVAQDPATGKVVEGGIVAETERVSQNLSAVLKAAGKSFDDAEERSCEHVSSAHLHTSGGARLCGPSLGRHSLCPYDETARTA